MGSGAVAWWRIRLESLESGLSAFRGSVNEYLAIDVRSIRGTALPSPGRRPQSRKSRNLSRRFNEVPMRSATLLVAFGVPAIQTRQASIYHHHRGGVAFGAELGAVPECRWSVIDLGYGGVTSAYTLWLLVPSLVFVLVALYFLFTPVARAYFAREAVTISTG